MECFVIFVMAWCWCNATESKPQNVSRHPRATQNANDKHKKKYKKEKSFANAKPFLF